MVSSLFPLNALDHLFDLEISAPGRRTGDREQPSLMVEIDPSSPV